MALILNLKRVTLLLGVALFTVFIVTGSTSPNPQDNKNSTDDPIYKSTEVTKAAVILSKPVAEYSSEARKNRVSGTVILLAVLRASGEVTDLRPMVALPDGLVQTAIDAAHRIKFTPAKKDDRKVSVRTRLEYRFVCDPSCHGAP